MVQLYHFNDDVGEILVKRAKEAGYKAIVLTVDTPSPSPKERDVRNQLVRRPDVHWDSLRDRPDLVPCERSACRTPLIGIRQTSPASRMSGSTGFGLSLACH